VRLNLLRTNTLLKLTSLILAIVLWFFVVSSRRSELMIDIPVRFVNVPQALELVDHHKTISIVLEGQERLLRRLDKEDVSVVINLNGYKEGRISYYISSRDIRVPDSFVIKDIHPPRVEFSLRKINDREVRGR
jgi:YbbR domain-containing protein